MNLEQKQIVDELLDKYTYLCNQIFDSLDSCLLNPYIKEKYNSDVKVINKKVCDIVSYILFYPDSNAELGVSELRRVNADLSSILGILNLELGNSAL